MSYQRGLLITLLVAACGDNRNLEPAPDAPPDSGPAVCSLALSAGELAAGAWDPRFTIPGFTGHDGHAPTLYDFARDIDGSIVAAGEFNFVGSDHVAPLLRYKNGAWQPARTTWELTPPGSGFSAVAIAPDGKLALATYDDFGPRSGEIWLDDGSGLRKIGAFDGLVRKLLWFGGKLWVAGWDVVHQGTTTIQGLAVWDGTTWAAPPGGAPTGFAFELVQDGSELLVGGIYDHIGGIAAGSVAAYNGTTWRALDFPGGVAVYALARGADNQLYAGGVFGDVDHTAGGFARWTGSAWVLAGGGLGNRALPGTVTDVVQHDGSLYVSGCFLTAGGAMDAPGAVTSRDVARFDGTWHALDDDTSAVFTPWVEPLKCGDEGPDSVWDVSKQSMFSDGNRVLLAGSFTGVAGAISQAVIAYDGSSWRSEGGAGGLGFGGSLDHIGVSASGCDVWGLAAISHAAGAPTRAHVVQFTGDGWTSITDTIPREAYCPGFSVAPDGQVAVGCMIFPKAGDPIGRIYRVNGPELVQVGKDLPLIQTIAYDADGKLWIGGGGATGFLGRLDGEVVTMIEEGFDAPVTQIDPVAANDVIATGYFTKVGTLDASRIARWNGTTWSALGAGLPGMATALAHDASGVYVSTYDDGSGGGGYLLGKYDGTTWSELATAASGITANPYFNFNAIKVIDGAIVAVGSAELDDRSGRGALVYSGGTFRSLGNGGVHAVSLSGLAVTHDAIWVGGSIAEAGNGSQATPSVGVARYVIAH